MADFPNAKKTFTAVVNGVTKLVAALFNSPYDEIEAVQTFVGPTGGGTQAFTESLTNLLRNYRCGVAVEYKGVEDLYVRSGEIAIVDSSGNRRFRRNTSDTTVTWSDIDTGSEENSTVYYVYAVADASATTFTVKISKSASAPSGATFYKLLGSFTNNSSGNIGSIKNLYSNSEINSVLDYGTSASAFTTRTGETLKICYGSLSLANSASQEISNLPFLSSSSYSVNVTLAQESSTNFNVPVRINRSSGSAFTIYNKDGDAGTISFNWIAIGV